MSRFFVMPLLVIEQVHCLRYLGLLLGPMLVLSGTGLLIAETKTETFDSKPDWESFNNRVLPDRAPLVTHNFGYSRTTFAGTSVGEIGGEI